MPPTVLFVDDDANLLSGMMRTLRKENFAVKCARSAGEALQIMAETEIALVVSDQDMPGMKGTDLLMRVRRFYPDTVCFILTGKATLDTAIAAINQGQVQRFFVKPCDPADLTVAIRHALQQRELSIQARKLFKRVQEQGRVLEEIEKLHPGLTRVERDADGAILLDEPPADHDEFMRRIYELLGEPPPTL
ncbi:response regulator [bacterium]|nr:response regulator [bacterium]